ncbi:lanC-like protein 2 [Fopius arisanus]|uniref:LanC-like protein 2 n=1 Tax=Fopius arisanus TaxID=64838 RepID=A0A9R1THB4_9HYME|nr:PREDICTED: lanC-like protein 2 [Fopius arisanus]XP_011308986.1 PREDICTED: lanC-like protein 2 [Fopius arisanus]XP_011308987.1 PREDICTED: lanC-like protein 2 [Fopius arisanus]XP_011308988.1 PREDICTED: lanC-like protein 2 [Fopius arisanus]
MAEDISRHYANRFPDFTNENSRDVVNTGNNSLSENFEAVLEQHIHDFIHRMNMKEQEWINRNDSSVYTGISGIAYLFFVYGERFNEPTYIDKAVELIEGAGGNKNDKKSITFLTGEAGRLAVGALIHHSVGNDEKSTEIITRLKSLYDFSAMYYYDELLYGRAGYLYSLLFVNKNISEGLIDEDLIKKVINCILTTGKNYSASRRLKIPLMYSWHEKEYLGGAHGIAGILYVLLQAREYLTDAQLNDEIKPSIDYLITLRFSSGNFPSSIGNKADRLVHWCHGAPSMTMLFTLAFEIFKEEKYLNVAKSCGEIIWERGLLKKGCGICHGTAGNAYTFLNLYQQTQDIKYLYQAATFAEWCFSYEKYQNRIPDRPFSLFEGLAGIIYFLIDLATPSTGKFPGYTL